MGNRALENRINKIKELEKLSPKFKLVNVFSAEDKDGVEKGFITITMPPISSVILGCKQ